MLQFLEGRWRLGWRWLDCKQAELLRVLILLSIEVVAIHAWPLLAGMGLLLMRPLVKLCFALLGHLIDVGRAWRTGRLMVKTIETILLFISILRSNIRRQSHW